MSGYTIPGGSTVQPALVAYRAVTLSSNTTLVWPNQSQTPTDFAARVMNVTATAGSLFLTLPPANQVSTGFDLVLVNVGSNSFTVNNNGGGAIVTITPGQVYYLNLTDNSTANGTWYSFLFGSGGSSLSAGSVSNSAYDIIAIGSFLHLNKPVVSTSSTPVNVNADGVTHRGTTFEWSGGGGVVNLPLASAVGNGFYFHIINWGTGSLTITPTGGDTVDTTATTVIQPGNAALVIAGAPGSWFTLGRGMAQNFNVTEAVISVTGGTLVETNTQAQNIVQKFTGTLLSNQIVTFPAIVQIYYVQNATAGAFTMTFGAAGGGTTVAVPQGQNMIVFSDGTNVVNASNAQIGALSSLQLAAGTVGAPSLSFLGDITTGIYQPTTGTWAVALTGVEKARFTASGLQCVAFIPTGSTVPANGMYLPAANTLGFATNSSQVGSVNSTGNWVFNAPTSGTALTVNGFAGSDVADFNVSNNGGAQISLINANTGGSASANLLVQSNSGAVAVNAVLVSLVNQGQVGTGTNHQLNILTNNTARINVAAGGNVVVNPPGSGRVFTALGSAGSAYASAGAAEILLASTDASPVSVNNPTLVLTNPNNTAGNYVGIMFSGSDNVSAAHFGPMIASVFTNKGASGADAGFEFYTRTAAGGVNHPLTLTGAGVLSYNADAAGTFYELGFRDSPQNTQAGNYSLALVDRGRMVSCTNAGAQTITIPANGSVAFPVGTVIAVENQGTTAVSIAITTDTLRQAGTANTGTRTLAVNGLCSLVKRAATVWYISGAGVT